MQTNINVWKKTVCHKRLQWRMEIATTGYRWTAQGTLNWCRSILSRKSEECLRWHKISFILAWIRWFIEIVSSTLQFVRRINSAKLIRFRFLSLSFQYFRYPDGTVKLRNPNIELMDQDILYHLALGSGSHDLVEMFGDVKVSERTTSHNPRHVLPSLRLRRSLSAWAAHRSEWRISHITSWTKSATNCPPVLNCKISVHFRTAIQCTRFVCLIFVCRRREIVTIQINK